MIMEDSNIKLTTLSHKGGCGCKIGPSELADVLQTLPTGTKDPNVIVGLDSGDDAGVYQLTDELAIVQTLDFFTPIVDDPYDFGQVAAANAISDVYAMGGRPITALNIVAFPIANLPKSVLAEILRGASDKMTEADVSLVGGHSIDDNEPKFGLSVTGTVHPNKVLTNTGAQPGDKLILTKPIGVGITTGAIKKGLVSQAEIAHVTKVMTTLNKTAAEVMVDFDVHASTDVTGFGLLGHASEIAQGSDVGIQIHAHDVPVLPRAKELAENGSIPGGTKSNYQHTADMVTYPTEMTQVEKWILCDAVTSGGLLIAVAEKDAAAMLKQMQQKEVQAQIIGEVTEANKGKITVV